MKGEFKDGRVKKNGKNSCAALADKKGEDIKVIDISNVSVLQIILLSQTEPMTAKYMLCR